MNTEMVGWMDGSMDGFLALKENSLSNTRNGAQVKGGQDRLIALDPILESLKGIKLGSVFTVVYLNPSSQDSGLNLQQRKQLLIN